MKIIVVDNEKIACDGMVHLLMRMRPEDETIGFTEAEKALVFYAAAPGDVAVLDIEMPVINGIELAKRFKQINPEVNIIFTTGYSEYALEAIELHASGYLMKPVTESKLKKEFENLRYNIKEQHPGGLRVRAFGNFEVFVNETPLHFKYTKAKELLAYLVDRRGALCSNAELIAALWDGEEDQKKKISYLKNIRKDLQQTLAKYGYNDVIVHQRGMTGIMPRRINCDYFDWINGKKNALSIYRGEYMTQYSWAEVTHGWIDIHNEE